MKILAAVDGSNASLHAASMAQTLATCTNGSLTLIHVTIPAMAISEWAVMLPDVTAQLIEAGKLVVKEVAAKLELPEAASINLVGMPADVIADVARDQRFDLVVVGNTGRGAVARMLIGSVADRLVHTCQKPVLVVR
ncbi:MAG: universal stress protein [Archangium sp.]|nr:universal stress protein [Archangium sp.]